MSATIDPLSVNETSMADPNALENDLRSFYLSDSEQHNLFEEWEQGVPRGDSTTPSISSPTYRWWILEHLRNALNRDRKNLLLSLGAGNAFVERVLCREGYPVLAVDALEEAVDLARRAGVPSICRNLYNWEGPADYWDVIYADGLLGHLHDGHDGAHIALRLLRTVAEGAERDDRDLQRFTQNRRAGPAVIERAGFLLALGGVDRRGAQARRLHPSVHGIDHLPAAALGSADARHHHSAPHRVKIEWRSPAMPMSANFKERLEPDLAAIAEHFGTPFHIYDEQGILASAERLVRRLRGSPVSRVLRGQGAAQPHRPAHPLRARPGHGVQLDRRARPGAGVRCARRGGVLHLKQHHPRGVCGRA